MRALALVILVGLVGCESARSPSPSPTPVTSTPATPDAGTAVASSKEAPTTYIQLCAICHGADAKGYKADHAPSLVTSTFLESATDEFLTRSIAEGRPGTAMAAYGKALNGPLDEAQVGEIVSWIRAQGPALKPSIAVAKGDANAGAAIYAKMCHSCHGDAKQRGEGISLANITFQKTATPSFVHYAITKGRPGTKMVPYESVLTTKDVDDVTAFIFDGLTAMSATAQPEQLPAPTGKEPLVINPNGKDPTFSPRSDPCPPGDSMSGGCVPNNRYVPAEQIAKALADKRKMIIIDARPASDWMRVHVTGAVSIPHHDPKRLDEIKNDGTWVLAYCACPHHLSGDIVDMLKKKGFKNAAILDEGILEWHRRGYPVVAAPGVTPPPKQTDPGHGHEGHGH